MTVSFPRQAAVPNQMVLLWICAFQARAEPAQATFARMPREVHASQLASSLNAARRGSDRSRVVGSERASGAARPVDPESDVLDRVGRPPRLALAAHKGGKGSAYQSAWIS
jgi:hypothetical protein